MMTEILAVIVREPLKNIFPAAVYKLTYLT